MKKLLHVFLICSCGSINTIAQTTEFWGMTTHGAGYGTIFKTDGNANNFEVKKKFYSLDYAGTSPFGDLVQASNGKLYAMTQNDGTQYSLVWITGVIFEYDPYTDVYTQKIDFDNVSKGRDARGTLMLAGNRKLYGMTAMGGLWDDGVLFEYDPISDIFIKKVDFSDTLTGKFPQGSLVQASNGKIYGMTKKGGAHDDGVIFEYDPVNDVFIKKMDFYVFDPLKGSEPLGSLMQASNGKLYGMTWNGGSVYYGVLFEYDPATNIYKTLVNFNISNGSRPWGSLIQADNSKLYGLTAQGGANDEGVLFEYDIALDTLILKVEFDDTLKGKHPRGTLLQASNGKLYGVTTDGGKYGYGLIFEYDIVNDSYTKKVEFDNVNGANPWFQSLIEINDVAQGIGEQFDSAYPYISPNPTTGEVKIVFGELSHIENFKILNVLGQIISEKNNFIGKEFIFDLTNQTIGLYFIEVINKGSIYRTKIIKQ